MIDAPRKRSMLSPLDPAVVVMFAAAWCGVWAEISLANVVSGLVIGAVLRFTLRGETSLRSVRIVPLVKLIALVGADLVKSTAHVVYEVLTPTDYTDEVIIEVGSGLAAADHLLLLTTVITLTPGTAVVDVDPETGVLFLHLLHAETEPDVVEHVKKLVRLAVQAFPFEREVASAERVTR